MTVRTATVDDVESCLDVLEEVVNEGRWLGAEPPFDRAERRERLVAAIADEHAAHLVAVPERNAGCLPERNAGCVPERNDSCVPVVGHLGLHVARFGVADLGMCVAPDWRGRGVGSALVEEALATARRMGAHKVTLQVWPHNFAARRLYRRFGFVEEGRLRRHYRRRNGELWDAIIMGLILDEERPGSTIPDEDPDV